MQYKNTTTGTMGPASAVIHNGIAYPASCLARHADESHAEWIARLAAIGRQPVWVERPDVDINAMQYGEPVETVEDGVLVIRYPNPVAKMPVWSVRTRERMYIAPDADVPAGYTAVEPPADRLAQWDGAAWSVDAAALAASLRLQRDQLIAGCDWTQLSDAPLDDVQKAAWTAYRQALRDVPQQEDFPVSVVWPAAPAEA